MSYDPFSRGAHPVGVRTFEWTDDSRARSLPVEFWYPAGDTHAGEDLAEETQDEYRLLPSLPPLRQDARRDAALRPGRFPLVVFSHGFGGHRRQTTHLCIHLASRGYVVASVDHVGNTMLDMLPLFASVQAGGALPDLVGILAEFIEHRPADVSFTLDRALDCEALGDAIDPERIGMMGHSFGGWTTLAVTARDPRIRAALPLAPAGGKLPLPVNPLAEALDFDWGRDVPTLYLVADRDTLLPLDGMYELFDRTPGAKRMVVLKDADHMHFCDRVEQTHEMFRAIASAVPGEIQFMTGGRTIAPIAEYCPGEHAYQVLRGLGLAHMDAHLKQDPAARELLASDLEALLAARGIKIDVL